MQISPFIHIVLEAKIKILHVKYLNGNNHRNILRTYLVDGQPIVELSQILTDTNIS